LALGEQGMRSILSVLGKQWEFRPALWESLKEERQELLRLTQDQKICSLFRGKKKGSDEIHI